MKSKSLQRGVALFFLAFTFIDLAVIDLAFPQLCSEGLTALAVAGPVHSAGGKIPDDPHPEEPAQRSQDDEDCFCCCAHVLPGCHVSVGVIDVKPAVAYTRIPALPSPPPHGPFHPPRLS